MPFSPERPFTANVYIDLILIHRFGIKLQTIKHNLGIFVNYILTDT
jgi:hypothetical protein